MQTFTKPKSYQLILTVSDNREYFCNVELWHHIFMLINSDCHILQIIKTNFFNLWNKARLKTVTVTEKSWIWTQSIQLRIPEVFEP